MKEINVLYWFIAGLVTFILVLWAIWAVVSKMTLGAKSSLWSVRDLERDIVDGTLPDGKLQNNVINSWDKLRPEDRTDQVLQKLGALVFRLEDSLETVMNLEETITVLKLNANARTDVLSVINAKDFVETEKGFYTSDFLLSIELDRDTAEDYEITFNERVCEKLQELDNETLFYITDTAKKTEEILRSVFLTRYKELGYFVFILNTKDSLALSAVVEQSDY